MFYDQSYKPYKVSSREKKNTLSTASDSTR